MNNSINAHHSWHPGICGTDNASETAVMEMQCIWFSGEAERNWT